MSNIKTRSKKIMIKYFLILLFSLGYSNPIYSDPGAPCLQDWLMKISQGYSLLHLAALAGNENWVKFLLDSGINPNNRNRWRETALHCLMAEKDYHQQIYVITLLLQAGTDPNLANTAGITPVHIAAGSNSTEIFKLLVDYGGNLNSADSQGNTPVHFAAANPNPEIIELIIEHSANLNIQNQNGEYPLHWAVGNGNLLQVKTLLDHGVDPDVQDYSGNTPLHWAVFSENPDMVKLLIDRHCDLEIKNQRQLTALDIAEKFQIYSEKFNLIKKILTSADQI